MTSVDSSTFLSDGGYLQKGAEKNIKPGDLGNIAQFLPPSRWYRDEKIFQLEKRALFSTVSDACLSSSLRCLHLHTLECGRTLSQLVYRTRL